MGWQLTLLEATSDLELTQGEVTSLMSGVFEAGIKGMVAVGMVGLFVRGFYDILGRKKYAKQEAEVLEMVKKIW